MRPNDNVTPRTTQTYGLFGFAQSNVDTSNPDKIIKPPIVGVPFLVTRWDCGPSLRIGCPLPCLRRNTSMIGPPNRKTNTNAVTMAPPVRNVRYRKTLRNETLSESSVSQ